MQRLTPIRQSIVTELAEHHLLSVQQLLDLLTSTYPTINKTTVYRSLEYLLAQNLVCRHTFAGDESLYESRDHHHDHVVCTSCGGVGVTQCHTHTPTEVEGFVVSHHHSTYFGICAECQKKQA